MSFQQELKKKLALDQFAEVFPVLEAAFAGKEQSNTVIQNKGRYHEVQTKWDNGTILRDDYSVTLNSIRYVLLQLVDQMSEEDKESGPAVTPLHPHHQFTCDRVDQSDLFHQLFDSRQDKKIHFFYIYGPEMQSHIGLFNRFSYDLEGRLQDYLNPDMQSSRIARRIEVTFGDSRNIQVYKQNILKSLFASFHVPVDELEPLLQKNLNHLLTSSPLLSGMSSTDFICVFLSISQWVWYPEITPQAINWLIESFCEVELPPASPCFLFFIGIIYEEDDSAIEEEILEVIQQSRHIQRLPELQVVTLTDINQWLAKYRMIASGGRIRRELIKKHFEENEDLEPEHRQKGEFNMEDVEIELQKMIDHYNQNRNW